MTAQFKKLEAGVAAKKVRETFLTGKVFAWAESCPKGSAGVVNGVVAAYNKLGTPILDAQGFEKSVLPEILASAGTTKCDDATKASLFEATACTFKELNAERFRPNHVEQEGPSEAQQVLASAMAHSECPKDVTEYVKNNVRKLYDTIGDVLGKHAALKRSMASAYAAECFNAMKDAGSHGLKFADDFKGYLTRVMEQVTAAYGEDKPRELVVAKAKAIRARVFADATAEVKETEGRDSLSGSGESPESATLDCINTRKYLYDAGAEMEDVQKVSSTFDMCKVEQVVDVVDMFQQFFPDTLVDKCDELVSVSKAGVNPNVSDEMSTKIICEFGVIIGFPICGDLGIEVVDFGYDPTSDRHECEFQCKCGNFVMEGAAGWDKNEWKKRISVAVTKALGCNRGVPAEKALEANFTRVGRSAKASPRPPLPQYDFLANEEISTGELETLIKNILDHYGIKGYEIDEKSGSVEVTVEALPGRVCDAFDEEIAGPYNVEWTEFV